MLQKKWNMLLLTSLIEPLLNNPFGKWFTPNFRREVILQRSVRTESHAPFVSCFACTNIFLNLMHNLFVNHDLIFPKNTYIWTKPYLELLQIVPKGTFHHSRASSRSVCIASLPNLKTVQRCWTMSTFFLFWSWVFLLFSNHIPVSISNIDVII